ncbi:PAS domain-containing protein [Devosia aurantiaca]|uniref:PAS domain S-box protein n=1 Tax=Devosia aurantiaca TaxID=2714858 RepID=A0A6M1SRV9_9HYPH|nr:PAS domain-containing protein [Devosia aurantiaca]NGP17123.1 PAS domain S-box protein [Devosia aurantiaca]
MTPDDIAELRLRLEEAEQTLAAIRDGQVDALVIETPDAAEIFTIEGEGQSYRAFMEAMDVGAAAVDDRGHILYVNANLAATLGSPLNSLQGLRFGDVIAPSVAGSIESVFRAAKTASRSRSATMAATTITWFPPSLCALAPRPAMP